MTTEIVLVKMLLENCLHVTHKLTKMNSIDFVPASKTVNVISFVSSMGRGLIWTSLGAIEPNEAQ